MLDLEMLKNLPPASAFTPTEAARLLGCTASAIRIRIKRGQLKAFKVGGQLFIKTADVQAFVQPATIEESVL